MKIMYYLDDGLHQTDRKNALNYLTFTMAARASHLKVTAIEKRICPESGIV